MNLGRDVHQFCDGNVVNAVAKIRVSASLMQIRHSQNSPPVCTPPPPHCLVNMTHCLVNMTQTKQNNLSSGDFSSARSVWGSQRKLPLGFAALFSLAVGYGSTPSPSVGSPPQVSAAVIAGDEDKDNVSSSDQQPQAEQSAEANGGNQTVSEQQKLIDAIYQSTPSADDSAEVADIDPMSRPVGVVRFAFDRTPWRDVIRWIADESNLALHVDELPTGSFSYADPRDFTTEEALDRINLFLQPEGYAILRSGRLLSVVNLADPRSKQQLDALARMIDPADLMDLPDRDVVRCLFPLGDIDASAAVTELEVLNLMVTPEVLGRTNQLLMIESVSKLRSVKKILDAFQSDEMENGTVVQSFALKFVEAEDVLEVARPHLGLAPGEMIGIDVSVSADIRGKHLYVTGVEDKVKLLEGLIESIDQPTEAQSASAVPPELRRHPVEGGNADTVYNVLQTLLSGQDVRLSIDSASNSIVAWAPPAIQEEINQTVLQLQAAEAEFEVIPLRTVDPFFVISLLEEMLDLPSAFADPDEIDPNTPKIDADPANRRLFVRAKRPQLEQIKKIISGLDGVLGSNEESVDPRGRTRILPIRGASARSIIEAATKVWEGENPVVLDESGVKDEKPRERVLTEGDSDSTETETPKEQKEPPQISGFSRPLGALAGRSAPGSLRNQAPAGGSIQRWVSANTKSTEPSIRCQLLPDGLVIQSEDVDALDRFESHLQTVSNTYGATVSPTIVFYLKYAKADDAVRMLADLIEGGEIANEVTDSTLVNGYVPSASYYGAFLTSREGMLTLNAGTMTVISDSRLNRLITQGSTEDVETVEEYLQIIDKDNSITSVETYGSSQVIELQHAKAKDVAETLRSAFAGRVIIDESKMAKQPAASGAQAQPRYNESRDDRDKKSSDSKSNNARGGQAIMDLAPKMTIAVHESSNSLIITAPQSLFQEVERLVGVIDSMAEQTVEVIAPSNGAVFESVLMRYLGQQGTSTRRPSSYGDKPAEKRESYDKRNEK